ncbi:MAG TPA: inositol monophosphatase [Patescibacteria group bacterium]|nr:inositol monophosphatase [Patescibacteria group bacterium]
MTSYIEKFLEKTLRGAGKILLKGFGEEHEINHKGEDMWSAVTKYDLESEKYILQQISKKYPKHGVLAEETGLAGSNKEYWIIDPLDGTMPYSRGLHQFCVLMAYVKNGVVQFGGIYDPSHDELYIAARGKGAYLNGDRIHVTTQKKTKGIVGGAFLAGGGYTITQKAKLAETLAKNDIIQIRWFTPALFGGFVASGRMDYMYCGGSAVWDYAAPSIILKEAGAKVTDFEGKPYTLKSTSLFAANPYIHKHLSSIIKH